MLYKQDITEAISDFDNIKISHSANVHYKKFYHKLIITYQPTQIDLFRKQLDCFAELYYNNQCVKNTKLGYKEQFNEFVKFYNSKRVWGEHHKSKSDPIFDLVRLATVDANTYKSYFPSYWINYQTEKVGPNRVYEDLTFLKRSSILSSVSANHRDKSIANVTDYIKNLPFDKKIKTLNEPSSRKTFVYMNITEDNIQYILDFIKASQLSTEFDVTEIVTPHNDKHIEWINMGAIKLGTANNLYKNKYDTCVSMQGVSWYLTRQQQNEVLDTLEGLFGDSVDYTRDPIKLYCNYEDLMDCYVFLKMSTNAGINITYAVNAVEKMKNNR